MTRFISDKFWLRILSARSLIPWHLRVKLVSDIIKVHVLLWEIDAKRLKSIRVMADESCQPSDAFTSDFGAAIRWCWRLRYFLLKIKFVRNYFLRSQTWLWVEKSREKSWSVILGFFLDHSKSRLCFMYPSLSFPWNLWEKILRKKKSFLIFFFFC